MKKIIMAAMIVSFGIASLNAVSATEINNTGQVKKGFVASPQKDTSDKEQKKHTMTGIIKAIDSEKKTITVESTKKKEMSLTFSYDGLVIKYGKKKIDISDLKIGDRLKITYTGDINTTPQIEKISLVKEKTKKQNKKSMPEKTNNF
ncbi:MAG: hypothetical protein KA059_02515 [Elusimicrobiales bacterium]|nr:hypothetical protein [Elusimicrobiales bacterium]